jgi:hypothetical protein
MNTVLWDGRDERSVRLPSGVYFFAVKTEGDYTTKKIIMVR